VTPLPYREPFRWDNGVVEIPSTCRRPEVGHFTTYLARYADARARKPVRPTFNVVMHSWSLLRRNSEGFHDSFAPEYEDRLHQICEHAARHGRARGYAEYLASLPGSCRCAESARYASSKRRRGPGGATSAARTVRRRRRRMPVMRVECVVERQWRFALDEYGDVLLGRKVLGVNLTPAQQRAFSRGGTDIGNLDDDVADGRTTA
jgi:hypothetical protein